MENKLQNKLLDSNIFNNNLYDFNNYSKKRGGNMELKDYSTEELFEELRRREDVEWRFVDFNQKIKIESNEYNEEEFEGELQVAILQE